MKKNLGKRAEKKYVHGKCYKNRIWKHQKNGKGGVCWNTWVPIEHAGGFYRDRKNYEKGRRKKDLYKEKTWRDELRTAVGTGGGSNIHVRKERAILGMVRVLSKRGETRRW